MIQGRSLAWSLVASCRRALPSGNVSSDASTSSSARSSRYWSFRDSAWPRIRRFDVKKHHQGLYAGRYTVLLLQYSNHSYVGANPKWRCEHLFCRAVSACTCKT